MAEGEVLDLSGGTRSALAGTSAATSATSAARGDQKDADEGCEMAETVAGDPAESEPEAAIQALSAAAMTVSKSAERLLVIAVRIVGLRERKNTRLSRSSVVALARRH